MKYTIQTNEQTNKLADQQADTQTNLTKTETRK